MNLCRGGFAATGEISQATVALAVGHKTRRTSRLFPSGIPDPSLLSVDTPDRLATLVHLLHPCSYLTVVAMQRPFYGIFLTPRLRTRVLASKRHSRATAYLEVAKSRTQYAEVDYRLRKLLTTARRSLGLLRP